MANEFIVKNGVISPTYYGDGSNLTGINANFNGGTVTGDTVYTGTLSADTLSATTYYGNVYQNTISKDFSGFIGQNDGNDDIDVSYDSTNRTITLAGTFKLYYQGVLILDVVADSWTSDPHPTGVTTTQFLKYNGNGFQWQDTVWNFHEAQIAYVCFKSTGQYCFAQREVHGLMDWESHSQFHYTIGTVLRSGGDLSDYVLASTTAANRRPLINATTVVDEDCKTIIPALTAETYTQLYLSGASAVNFVTGATDISLLNATVPYYNQWNGSAWVQTLYTNNQYGCIWVIAIPSTSDATAQGKRYIFVQGQSVNSTLTTIQALTTASLNLGDFTSISPEFVFISKIIIRYVGGGTNNWSIISVEKLTGNKVSSISTPGGSFLSSVSVDGVTITGDGTVSNPLVAIAGGTFTGGTVTNLQVTGTLSGATLSSDVDSIIAVRNLYLFNNFQ